MLVVFASPLFYLFLTLAIYVLFQFLSKKFKTQLLNPLLWTAIFMIAYIIIIVLIDKHALSFEYLSEELKNYERGTYVLDLLLAPVTVCLALPVYINRKVIKENWVAIIVATVVGVATSMGTVALFSYFFGLGKEITYALLPKGVTTAIAKEISSILGVSNYVSITVTAVVITGILGSMLGPVLIKLFKGKDAHEVYGLALGSSSHSIGTSKAIDLNEKAGAIASVAIVTNGLLAVVTSLIISLIR